MFLVNRMICFVLFSFFLILGCKQKSSVNESLAVDLDMKKFSWMQGAWTGGEIEDRFFQYWGVINDSVITGENLIVLQNDTLFFHSIRIFKKGHTIVYKTEPKWMFETPASYKIKVNSNGEHVFEALENEFPQRIIFVLNADGSMYYRLEGVISEQTHYEDFVLYKSE